MQTVTTIGLDIAKSVFQVHGVDAAGAWRPWRKPRTHGRRGRSWRKSSDPA